MDTRRAHGCLGWPACKTSFENGGGKIQNLAVTIETSIKSPSVIRLGNTIQNLLQVIAILPQGLNKMYLTEMFPTVSDIQSCGEVLCKHSLAYQKNDYITLLAPIRLYIMDNYNKDPSYNSLFDDVQKFYLSRSLNDTAVIRDDVNIEHIAIFLLKTPIYAKQEIYVKQAIDLADRLCYIINFYKPRPLMLHRTIVPLDLDQYSPHSFFGWLKRLFNPYDGSSVLIQKGKHLAVLARSLRSVGQVEDGDKAWNAARQIFLRCGNSGRISLAFSSYDFGMLSYSLGDCRLAEEYLELALKYYSRSLGSLFSRRRLVSDVKLGLGKVALQRGRLDAAKTILSVLPSFKKYADSCSIDCLLVAACAERVSGRYEDAKKHLEQAESMGVDLGIPEFHLHTLYGLVEVAELQGDRAQAKALRSKTREITKRLPEGKILDINDATIITAAYTAMEGDVEQAREIVAPVIAYTAQPENLSVIMVECIYGVGCIELFARNLDKAKEYFQDAIEHSVSLSELHLRALSERALGELALWEENFTVAKERFSNARALCETMGVPTRCLYYTLLLCLKLEEYKGWTMFLQGNLPIG